MFPRVFCFPKSRINENGGKPFLKVIMNSDYSRSHCWYRNCCVTKIATCPPIIGQVLDTMIVVSIVEE